MSEIDQAYRKAQDLLAEAQKKLRLSEALSEKSSFYSPSPERKDYVRDLETQAFHLFEAATQAFKAADYFRGSP